MIYKDSLIEAMGWLGEQPDTLFIGQTVGCAGSYMFGSLEKVPMAKRQELPVCEETQMGMTLGLALEGYTVVSVYPRIDFLLLAMNQLVNHVDKIKVMSDGKMQPRIIIRTSIGPKQPLDGGPQHTQDHTDALRRMLTMVSAVEVLSEAWAMRQYRKAYERGGIWLFVEDGSQYV